MATLRIKRIIITCPKGESFLYLVIGDHVGKAQNGAKSHIFEELLNLQI